MRHCDECGMIIENDDVNECPICGGKIIDDFSNMEFTMYSKSSGSTPNMSGNFGNNAGPNNQGFGMPGNGNNAGPNNQGFGMPGNGNNAGPNNQGFGMPGNGNNSGPNNRGFGMPGNGNYAGPNNQGYGMPGNGNNPGPNNQGFRRPGDINYGAPINAVNTPQYVPTIPLKTTVMGIWGFILGILSIVFPLVEVLFFGRIGIEHLLLVAAALFLNIGGLVVVNKKKRVGRGICITGLVFTTVSIIILMFEV